MEFKNDVHKKAVETLCEVLKKRVSLVSGKLKKAERVLPYRRHKNGSLFFFVLLENGKWATTWSDVFRDWQPTPESILHNISRHNIGQLDCLVGLGLLDKATMDAIAEWMEASRQEQEEHWRLRHVERLRKQAQEAGYNLVPLTGPITPTKEED